MGFMQGPRAKVDAMGEWLARKGSPLSRIDKCTLTPAAVKPGLKTFAIVK